MSPLTALIFALLIKPCIRRRLAKSPPFRYRRVHIDPKEEDLEKRWEAIETFHKKAKWSDLCDAARVFFGMAPKSEGFLQKYREEFKATDGAFAMRNNDAEV